MAINFQEDSRHYKWGNEFNELLKNNASATLDAKLRYFENEKHLTIPVPATYYGPRYIFEGFELDINEVCKNSDLINQHDIKISRKMGLAFKSDEGFVNILGNIALHERNIPDVAVAILEINAKNYPSSVNVLG